MQEALIHLWQIPVQQPGPIKSWYLRNCRFHALHIWKPEPLLRGAGETLYSEMTGMTELEFRRQLGLSK